MKKLNLKLGNNRNGITLIALVITIIVLLILAGVTIAALTGDNGILSQSARAKKENEKASIIEEIRLEITAKQMDNLGSINDKDVYDILEKYGTLSTEDSIMNKTLTTKDTGIAILVKDILHNITLENDTEIGKHTFSILGDSISSYKGYTYPINNMQWYPNNDSSTQGYNKGDITNVEEMWWSIFSHNYDMILEQNNSYSGSTICYDGYGSGTNDGKDTSFCKRVETIPNSDLIIILGGTNDFWTGASMGDYKYSNWTETDKECFRPALAYLLNYVKQNHPDSQIVFILNNGISNEVSTSIETICANYNVNLLKLSNIDKSNYHPTVEGMKTISEQLITFLDTLKTPVISDGGLYDTNNNLINSWDDLINKGLITVNNETLSSVSTTLSGKLVISSNITNIQSRAFYKCSAITSIEIPSSITTIENSTFRDCSKLTSITIPNSIIKISDNAFYNCFKLTSILFNGTQTQWDSITKGELWDNYTGNYTIHCTEDNTHISK